MRIVNFVPENMIFTSNWGVWLIHLRVDSKYTVFNKEFYQYLNDEWNIKISFDEDNIISRIEVTDETYTMLLLKYPLNENKF